MSYEYYDVIYSDKGEYKSFKCEAQGPEDAEDQLRDSLKGKRNRTQFEIMEVIPMGLIGGCEITMFDRQILEL